MSLSRQVTRNAGASIGGRLYTSLLAFVITAVVLPRQLDEAAVGVFAFYLTLYQLLTNVLDFGANTIVVREASRRREDAGRLIGLLVRIKATVAGVGVLLVLALGLVFEGWGLPFAVLCLASLHLLFHAPAAAGVVFHVDMAFRWVVVLSVLGQTVWLAGTVALLLAGVVAPMPYLVAFGLGTVTHGVLSYRLASRRVRVAFDAPRGDLGRLWRESWPAGVSMAMASVYFYVDAVMLRPLAGEVAVAHYTAAYRIMTFLIMVPVLFSQVIFPVFSRLAHRPGALTNVFRQSVRILGTVGVLCSATAPLVRREVLAIVFPPEYGAAAGAFGILCVAVAVVFVTYPHVLLLLACGHQRVMMRISTAAAALNIVANLLVIPRFGIEGAAWATVGTEVFVLVAAGVQARRLTGIAVSVGPLLRPAACALAASAMLWWVLAAVPPPGDVARVLVGIAVAGAAALGSGLLPIDLGTEEGAPGV